MPKERVTMRKVRHRLPCLGLRPEQGFRIEELRRKQDHGQTRSGAQSRQNCRGPFPPIWMIPPSKPSSILPITPHLHRLGLLRMGQVEQSYRSEA